MKVLAILSVLSLANALAMPTNLHPSIDVPTEQTTLTKLSERDLSPEVSENLCWLAGPVLGAFCYRKMRADLWVDQVCDHNQGVKT